MKRNKIGKKRSGKRSTYPLKKAFLVRENKRRRQAAKEQGIAFVPVTGDSYPMGSKPWK